MKNLISRIKSWFNKEPIYRAEMCDDDAWIFNGNIKLFHCGRGIPGMVKAQRTVDKMNNSEALRRAVSGRMAA